MNLLVENGVDTPVVEEPEWLVNGLSNEKRWSCGGREDAGRERGIVCRRARNSDGYTKEDIAIRNGHKELL